ncbi:MAG: radical SAM protein [Planctomycetota bacterium]
MIQRKKKIVLYQPKQVDETLGLESSKDMLPLEMLTISAYPLQDGYDIEIVDGSLYAGDEGHRRLLAACEDAMLVATTGILGYMVTDGYLAIGKVKARFPDLPAVIGGWFASVRPDLQLETGYYEAVVLGQGELTFRDVVRAIDAGEPLDDIAGLALWRDGQVVKTERRGVAGWEEIPNVPWHLLDIEPYKQHQMRAKSARDVLRLPTPPWIGYGKPYFGITYFASYGCPEPCTFCCSPIVTGRRWKAIPGKALAEDIAELQQRFGFDMLRFQDANFGVAPKRTQEFCETLVDLNVPIWWNGTIEIETIMRYDTETLDLLEASKCHLLWLGAETGTAEMQDRIKKHIKIDHIPKAIGELVKRNIVPGTFWIIGFPGETQESMEATLKQAAHTKFLYPIAGSDVYPFRPIPGTHDYREAIKLGYQPPKDFREWGDCFEYKYNSQNTPLPESVRHTWQRYNNTAAIYDMHIQEGPLWMRRLLSKMAGRRLKKGSYGFPIEQKLFDIYVKATGQGQPKAKADLAEDYQQLQPETHAQISGKVSS